MLPRYSSARAPRYGPAAPLVDFTALLDRAETFALDREACDIAASGATGAGSIREWIDRGCGTR